jgi:plasmid stabilization system protein ParE
MKVVWSKESLNRLIEIEEFIAENNPSNAIEFTDFLVSKSLLIEENPGIGRTVPEFSDPDIRELIIKGYRLVYRLGKGRIDILTVFEGHRLIRKSEIFFDEE